MSLAEQVKANRERTGMTQEQLAGEVGVSRQSVGSWEAGRATPDTDKLSVLARIFGCSVDSLLYGPEILKRKEVRKTIVVPVLHPSVTVCAGEGFRLEDVLIEADDFQEIPLDDSTGKLGDLSPFLVKAEGNSVRAAYNYAEHLETRREMMQWWADWLDEQRDKRSSA